MNRLATSTFLQSIEGSQLPWLQRQCACGRPADATSVECEHGLSDKTFGLQPELVIGSTYDPLEEEPEITHLRDVTRHHAKAHGGMGKL